MNESKLTFSNLAYALLFLALGIFLAFGNVSIIGLISQIVGSIFIIIGIVKIVIYIYMKGKLGDYSINDLLIGFVSIFCGVILIIYSEAFSFALKIIIGLLVLYFSINRIILAISIKKQLQDGFWVYLGTGLLMFLAGILLLIIPFSKVIGYLIIVYALSEIISYIYYKVTYRESNVTSNPKKKKKKVDRLTTKKTVEAEYEEETNEE